KNQPLTYERVGRTIVVKKRERHMFADHSPSSVVEAPFIVITGRVLDNNGVPLANVSVVLKGGTTGVSTDANGAFSINVPDEKAVLVFSYVGYKNQELPVGSQKNISLVLQPETGSLED